MSNESPTPEPATPPEGWPPPTDEQPEPPPPPPHGFE